MSPRPNHDSESLEGRTVGNYVLEGKLGSGGMGAVYLARHPIIGRRVAIKVMRSRLANDEKAAVRFFAEARAVNQIRHPNIVEIFDFGREGSFFYFTMECLEGESLAQRIRREKLSPAQIQHIAEQLCAALTACHERGIIHRDLKPENIFLCTRGDDDSFVKVLDFGLAKMPSELKTHETGVLEIFGTPAYMSPEQCEGAANADARSDVYSLGVILYELLAGRIPFAFPTAGQTMIAHLSREPAPPSTLNAAAPRELDLVVLRALAKQPSDRFQSMAELAQALREPRALRQQLSTRRMDGAAPSRRRLVIIAVVAAALAFVVGGVAGRLRHRGAPAPSTIAMQPKPQAIVKPPEPIAKPEPIVKPPEPIVKPQSQAEREPTPSKAEPKATKHAGNHKRAKTAAPADNDPQKLKLIAPTFGDQK